jgi:phosphoribosylanthranilate isomerase
LRTRIKICGITREIDAIDAVQAGADAIGLVFYAPSPRAVTIGQAQAIVKRLPPFVSVVGLFVDADAHEVKQVLSQVHIDLLQFHGEEPQEYCRQFNRPYMKAIRVKPDTNLLQYAQIYNEAKALLLDTYTEGAVGGTGKTFDWGLIPQHLPVPVVLAGGLNVENVGQAIQQVRPFAVDVSGGVEVNKGVKDAAKMAAFVLGVSNATV